MPILTLLMDTPGVIAAGEFSYKGEIVNYKGDLSPSQAELVSTLCLANTVSINMQAEIYCSFDRFCGVKSVPGWIVRGHDFSVCAIGPYFCFLRNNAGTLNEVTKILRDRYEHKDIDPLVFLYEKIGGNPDEKLI